VFVFIGGAGALPAVTPGPSSDEDGPSISGAALRRATDAALAETGGGRVTGTEVGAERSYYEVEVSTPDGWQVDVLLDRSFDVVG